MDFLIEHISGGHHDLVMENNDFVLVGRERETHGQAVKQKIAYVIGTWFGESAFDRSVGFPWKESVFGTEPIDGVSALVQARISVIPGVDGFETPPELRLDNETSRLFIHAQIKAGEFVLPINNEIQGTV